MLKITDRKNFINFTKTFNWIAISGLSLITIVMLSSFIVRMAISPPIDSTLDDGAARNIAEEVIQVNVLNGCGVDKLAAKTKKYMRGLGFDVVEIGNYNKHLTKTIIFDRAGDLKSAMKVAYAIGVDDSLIIDKIDSSMFLRCTIALGDDYAQLKPFN